MRRWRILAVALAASLSAVPAALGQPARSPFAPASDAPTCKYAVTPEAGDWLICVQTFKGEQAQPLAEEMVELLRGRDYRLQAYVYDRGHKERSEEEQRIQKLRDQYWDTIEKMQGQGIEPIGAFRYRTMRIPKEFAVMIGKSGKNLKDMNAARDFLNDVRKLKAPPTKFSSAAVIGAEDAEAQKVDTGYAFVNPFTTAMVARNPAIPMAKKTDDMDKADEFLKEINAGEVYSVFKAAKPWTLVVKIYQGQVIVNEMKKPGIMARIGFGKKEPELLNASAAQAHATADFLRKMKPSYEAFVMHNRTYSLVSVGVFDGQNDPNLIAAQKTLAGLQLKDQKSGAVLETLNAQPAAMKIPK